MTTMFGDVTDLQQRHHSQNIPRLVEKIKGFPLKAKSFTNIATVKNPRGVPYILSFSLPLVPRWGIALRVHPRVTKCKKVLKNSPCMSVYVI